MRVEFPKGLMGTEGLPRTRRRLENCWWHEGKIIGRPGIRELNTTGKIARGSFVWNDSLYNVTSQKLIKITDTETGVFDTIGTIGGVTGVETDVGFNDAVIVVRNGPIYALSKTDALIEISDNDNFVPCRDVAHINGRFVYIPFDGSPAFFSDVGQAESVQAESFFDAETLPDKNNSVWNFKDTLYIGGTDSIELFQDTGASPNPFQRVNRGRITNGVIGGVLDYNETFLFVGREEDQSAGIYAIGQGYAPKISNETVDLILDGYTQSELESAIPGRLKWRGDDIATFTFPRDSLGYFAGNWFVLSTLDDGRTVPWKAGFITQYENRYYTAFEDKIGIFENRNTDYSDRVPRIIDLGYEQENNDDFSCQSLDLGISQGFSRTDGSVAILMSNDGLTYGEPLYRDLGALGEYSKHLVWDYPGGLGNYEGFMGVRIYTTEDVPFSSSHLIADFR